MRAQFFFSFIHPYKICCGPLWTLDRKQNISIYWKWDMKGETQSFCGVVRTKKPKNFYEFLVFDFISSIFLIFFFFCCLLLCSLNVARNFVQLFICLWHSLALTHSFCRFICFYRSLLVVNAFYAIWNFRCVFLWQKPCNKNADIFPTLFFTSSSLLVVVLYGCVKYPFLWYCLFDFGHMAQTGVCMCLLQQVYL